MDNKEKGVYKFIGGIRVGMLANSWPSGELEINSNYLILRDKMFKKEYKFLKDDVIKIEMKKIFPIIAYGVRICHKRQGYNPEIYFWYVGTKFKEFIGVLRESGWQIQ